jgi:hypothetical protein
MLQLDWKGFYVFSHIDQTENAFGNNRKYMLSRTTVDSHKLIGVSVHDLRDLSTFIESSELDRNSGQDVCLSML